MTSLLITNATREICCALMDTIQGSGLAAEVHVLPNTPTVHKAFCKDETLNFDAQTIIYQHLLRLNFSPKRNGFQQLCICIPLFARNPYALLSKEIYPVAAEESCCSSVYIESVIRRAIKAAWLKDPEVWTPYFPNHKAAPSNKEFIYTLAQLLK